MFPGSTLFGLRLSDASWLCPVRFGSFPNPVPAGSRFKRFGSVRQVRFGFLFLPVFHPGRLASLLKQTRLKGAANVPRLPPSPSPSPRVIFHPWTLQTCWSRVKVAQAHGAAIRDFPLKSWMCSCAHGRDVPLTKRAGFDAIQTMCTSWSALAPCSYAGDSAPSPSRRVFPREPACRRGLPPRPAADGALRLRRLLERGAQSSSLHGNPFWIVPSHGNRYNE